MTMDGTMLLTVRGLSMKFGAALALDGVSLEVPAGSRLGIVGPNGAGKSTLLSIIAGQLTPTAGSVAIDGHDMGGVDEAGRARRGVARTFQIPRPFAAMTVLDNVLVGARHVGSPTSAAVEALEMVGLTHRANDLAGSLGFLDRRRLEMARAVAIRPRILLLDEVAGGLTDSEIPAVTTMVTGLAEAGVTIVWIEHVLRALLSVSTRLVLLVEGRVAIDGEPSEVMASDMIRRSYLGVA